MDSTTTPTNSSRLRRQCRSDLLQIIGQAFLIHDSILLITDNYNTVVRVQVNFARLRLRASFGLGRDRTLTLFVDLSRTVQFLGSRVLDVNGNPIVGATINADSGFDYVGPTGPGPSVPEPMSLCYLPFALVGLMFARGQIGRPGRQEH